MTSLIATHVAIAGRLEPTDLKVEAGELIALVGPNGGGKTSLLRALARAQQASGDVQIDSESVDAASPARRRHLLSFLPASRDFAWPIAARDVIALGLDRPDPERIEELIALLELEQLSTRPINQLSTGERARILTARALVGKPQILLLDEPLTNLDPYWVLRLMAILETIAGSGQSVIVALHDLSLLPRFHRALLIADGGVHMDEAPASLMASERFGEVFRISAADGGWTIRNQADRRSSP
jgi:iron complex transport system ATP-binding protein